MAEKNQHNSSKNTVFRKIARLSATCQKIAWRVAPLVRKPEQIPVAFGNLVGRLQRYGLLMVAGRVTRDYRIWLRLYETPSQRQVSENALLAHGPLVSFLLGLKDFARSPERASAALLRSLSSLRSQAYSNWEVLIAAPSKDLGEIFSALKGDPFLLSRCRTISCDHAGDSIWSILSSREFLTTAGGSLVVPVEPGDILAVNAAQLLAEEHLRRPSASWVYADSDELSADGQQRCRPLFLASWDEDLFYEQGLLPRLNCFVRAALQELIGSCQSGFRLVLTLARQARCNNAKFQPVHVPQVLLHRQSSYTADDQVDEDVPDAGELEERMSALRQYLDGLKIDASLMPSGYGSFYVSYALPRELPSVTVVIPSKDKCELLKSCVESLFAGTVYGGKLRTVVVNNGTTEPAALDYLAQLATQDAVHVISYDSPFNFSAMNNMAAQESKSDVLVFLNNDIEIVSSDWLTQLIGHVLRPEVGIVGAKLLFKDGSVQHAGLLLYESNNEQTVQALHRGASSASAGFQGRLRLTQQFSAVTGACMAVRRSVFDEVGGMDEKIPCDYSDVDLCLRVADSGYKIIWTPHAVLTHHEAATRGARSYVYTQPPKHRGTTDYVRQKWGKKLTEDRFFSPNLELVDGFPVLAFPPRFDSSGKC